MLEDFERFTKTGSSFLTRVSIRRRGQIGFSNGAVERFNISDYEYAVMFISKDRKTIAIKLTNDPNEPGAVKIMKKTGNFAFGGKAFLDCYSIDYKETHNYDAKYSEEDKAIIFSIE